MSALSKINFQEWNEDITFVNIQNRILASLIFNVWWAKAMISLNLMFDEI